MWFTHQPLSTSFTLISSHLISFIPTPTCTSSTTTTMPSSLVFSITLSLSLSLSLFVSATYTAPSSSSSVPLSVQCRPGTFYNITSAACHICSPGTYSWGGNFDTCLSCPSNTYTPYKGVVDISLCTPCPPNYTSPPSSSTCFRRRTRRSSTSSTYSSPLSLPLRTRCGHFFIPPPQGVSYFPSRRCVSPITGCPAGLHLKLWARRVICADKKGIVKCPIGTIFDGVDRCLKCPTGSKIVPAKEDRKWMCERCSGNSVSSGGVTDKCITCKCGFARSYNGSNCIRTTPIGISVSCD